MRSLAESSNDDQKLQYSYIIVFKDIFKGKVVASLICLSFRGDHECNLRLLASSIRKDDIAAVVDNANEVSPRYH